MGAVIVSKGFPWGLTVSRIYLLTPLPFVQAPCFMNPTKPLNPKPFKTLEPSEKPLTLKPYIPNRLLYLAPTLP